MVSDFAQELRKLLKGQGIRVVRREADWAFLFGSGLQICTNGLWRLRDRTGILVTDLDDGHQFGLPAPVDAQDTANGHLSKSIVTDVAYDPNTGDLELSLGRDQVLEVITSSMAYETWQMYSGNGFEAAVGNGGLR